MYTNTHGWRAQRNSFYATSTVRQPQATIHKSAHSYTHTHTHRLTYTYTATRYHGYGYYSYIWMMRNTLVKIAICDCDFLCCDFRFFMSWLTAVWWLSVAVTGSGIYSCSSSSSSSSIPFHSINMCAVVVVPGACSSVSSVLARCRLVRAVGITANVAKNPYMHPNSIYIYMGRGTLYHTQHIPSPVDVFHIYGLCCSRVFFSHLSIYSIHTLCEWNKGECVKCCVVGKISCILSL